LHNTKWKDGEKKKGWKPLSSKKKNNNSIQDSEGDEESRYPVADFNKTMINFTKEPSRVRKNALKEEILEEISEKFMEKILDWLNRMYKMHSRNLKTLKIRNMS
jgi:hypothetical protein